MKVICEIKDNGTPVIKYGTTHSHPVSYHGVATLVLNNKTYYAVSNYYEGIFPVGVVFTVHVKE